MHLGLVAVTLVTAFLNFYRLHDMGYSNLYYAASVRSMLTGWHNFFFVSFDPAGFVSVDKPPLGLWVQALSAKLFGFSGFSLILPQAVAGVASVVILYLLVRGTWGSLAGFVAASVLAISPINVVTSRNNALDTQLLLILLVATWAISHASEQGSRRWLLLGFTLVGVGFNIKMLQAYLVLPAFYTVYFLAASDTWRKRMHDLVLATILLLLTSAAWAVAVDLTPADQRPFVGASGNNHELSLVMFHNGAARLVGSPGRLQGQDIGNPGPLRFLHQYFAGQVSWFLPLAIMGLALLVAHRPWLTGQSANRYRLGLLLWGSWGLTLVVFFSIITYFQIYYLVMLIPAIAVLTGIAISELVRALRRPGWRRYLLPASLMVTLALHLWILSEDAFWSRRLFPLLLGLGSISVLILIGAHIVRANHMSVRLHTIAATVGMIGLLIGPAVWTAIPVARGQGTIVPIAGPDSITDPRVVTDSEQRIDSHAVAFLDAHRKGSRYLVATLTSFPAAPLIVASGEAVMTLGGWKGEDDILSVAQVEDIVDDGTVRYFLVPRSHLTPPDRKLFPADVIGDWVRQYCTLIADGEWRSPSALNNAWSSKELYDCVRREGQSSAFN